VVHRFSHHRTATRMHRCGPLLAITLAACAEKAGLPPREVAFSYSSGVELVESWVAQWDVPSHWRVGDTPRVSIGADTASRSTLLNGVIGAIRLDDGRIAILQRSTASVVVFNRAGQLTETWGRKGLGPGEFSEPAHISLDSGIVRVWEARFGRVTSMDQSGNRLDEYFPDLGRVQDALGSTLSAESFVPLANRSFIAIANRRDARPPNPSNRYLRPPIQLHLITGDYTGTALGEYGGWQRAIVDDNGRRVFEYPAFPERASFARSADGIELFATDGNALEVNLYSAAGTLRRIIRWHADPVPIGAQQADSARRMYRDRNLKSPEARAGWERRQAALPSQTTFPLITGLVQDTEGFLWVERLGLGWSVFDPSGQWMGELEVPLTRIFGIGRDYILGVLYDEDDVEQVIQLDLRRSGTLTTQ
jgi:hypothetical protein